MWPTIRWYLCPRFGCGARLYDGCICFICIVQLDLVVSVPISQQGQASVSSIHFFLWAILLTVKESFILFTVSHSASLGKANFSKSALSFLRIRIVVKSASRVASFATTCRLSIGYLNHSLWITVCFVAITVFFKYLIMSSYAWWNCTKSRWPSL